MSTWYIVDMQQRILGTTGIAVSVLGLGSTKFGRNQEVKYPHPFSIPEDKQLIELLDCARDVGINLIDTAPAYGNSEERIGKLIKNTRHNWIISTKVGEEFIHGKSHYDFTPEYAKKSIARSLKRLHTDYLDIVLVHSDGNDVYNIEHFGILHYLAELKQQGLVRAIGMSTKTMEGGLLALSKSDVIMMTFNPIYTDEQPVIHRALELHKGILIKKALASGRLNQLPGSDPIQSTLQFILKEPGVSSIILGTINPIHLLKNAAAY